MRPLTVAVALYGTVALTAPAPPQARLSYLLAQPYPGFLYGPFDDGLTDSGGCVPLYVSSPAVCALIRDEPGWIDLSVQWSGTSPIRLWRRGDELVLLHTRKAPTGANNLPVTADWSPGTDPEQSGDGSVVLDRAHSLGIRVDLSELTHSGPAGVYDLCFQPNFTPQTGVRWADSGDVDCYRFELLEADTDAARLERLRRRAIDRLASFKCSEAAPIVDEMLGLEAESAVAYRLRGIIAELERRQFDAIADYAQAVELLRTAGDPHLHMTREAREQIADGLAGWLLGLQLAQGHSLIGATEQGPACR